MKVAYCSDLHREFRLIELENTEDADVLILAGDIDTISNIVNYDMLTTDFFDSLTSQFKNVIYVCGNHEYYGGKLSDIDKLRAALETYPTVHVLQNSKITIDGITFLGGTLWTDFDDGNPIVEDTATRFMNDYHQIEGLTTDIVKADHYAFIKFLNENKPVDVVVTHHAPSYKCIAQRYSSSRYNPLYATELDTDDVKYWVYGHLHGGNDFEKFGCQIVTNSRGYPQEKELFLNFKLKYFTV